MSLVGIPKCNSRFIAFFEILKSVDEESFKLNFLSHMKIHNVFYVSQLQKLITQLKQSTNSKILSNLPTLISDYE